MKKIILSLVAILAISTISALSFSKNTFAAGCNDTFFGFPSWCRGLGQGDGIKPIGKSGIPIEVFVWTVVGNIADGIFRVVGVISLGFIVWGGYQYMLAMGDSGKIGRAKMTITNAVIGLMISVGASMIVSFVMGVF